MAAADDIHAPHVLKIGGPAGEDVRAAIDKILTTGYLPRFAGGEATWSVVSNRPIAVVAQQWPQPYFLDRFDTYEGLDVRDGILRLHFNYHAQLDPNVVVKVLWGLQLTAL